MLDLDASVDALDATSEGERQARGELNVDEVAAALKVTPTTVLRLIRQRALVAKQACRNAPSICA